MMKKLLFVFLFWLVNVIEPSSFILHSQAWLWSRQGTSGMKSQNFAPSVATNGSGKVWQTGSYNSSLIYEDDTLIGGNGYNVYTVNLDKYGNILWLKGSQYSVVPFTSQCVAVDDSSNSYITGYFGGITIEFSPYILNQGNGIHAFLVKYDAVGKVKWVKQAIGQFSRSISVASDGIGNEYQAGYFNGALTIGTYTLSTSNYAAFIAKYDGNGNVLWATQSSGSGLAAAHSIAYSQAGDEYVAGNFSGTVCFGKDTLNASSGDIYLAKYDRAGNILWATQSQSNEPNSSYDLACSIAADNYDNVYVTGKFQDSLSFGQNKLSYTNKGKANTFYTKFSPAGKNYWLKQAVPQDSNPWYGSSVSTDVLNHFYINTSTSNYAYSQGKISFGNLILVAPNNRVGGASALVEFDSSGMALCGSIIDDLNEHPCRSGMASDSCGQYIYMGGTFADEKIIVGDTLTPDNGGDIPFVARWVGCTPQGCRNFNAGIVVSPSTCHYACNGSAIATPSGGYPPYTYLWSNGETTQTATGLCAGSYSVLIGDSAGEYYLPVVLIISLDTLLKLANTTYTLCNVDSAQLGASGLRSYSWSPAKGLSCTHCPNPIATPTITTIYTVTGADSVNGCLDTGMVKVTVTKFYLNISKEIFCADEEYKLSAPLSASSYDWSPVIDLSCPSCPVTIATPSVTTTYTLSVVYRGCTFTDTITLQPLGPFNLHVSPINVTICYGDSVQLTASGNNIFRFVWSPDKWLSCDTCASLHASPTGTTTFTVTGYDLANCDTTAEVTIAVLTQNLKLTANTNTVCLGDSAQLTVSGGNNYLWSTGQTTDTIWVKPVSTSYYWVKSLPDSCKPSDSIIVNVLTPQLTFTVAPGDSACKGDSMRLDVSGGSTYLWSNGETSSQFWVKPPATTTYTVTATSGNCTITDSVTVKIFSLKLTVTPPHDTLCKGYSVTLYASGAKYYSWSPASGLSCTGCSDPVASPQFGTTYTVTGSDVNGCKGRDSVYIFVFLTPVPPFIIASADSICKNDTVMLTGVGGQKYLWNTGQTTDTIFVTPTKTTTYTLTVTNDICKEDTTITITDTCTDEGFASITDNSYITIYPNPSQGVFNILINSAGLSDLTAEIHDILGQPIYFTYLDRGSAVIELSGYAKGVYILTIRKNGSYLMVKKLVVY